MCFKFGKQMCVHFFAELLISNTTIHTERKTSLHLLTQVQKCELKLTQKNQIETDQTKYIYESKTIIFENLYSIRTDSECL